MSLLVGCGQKVEIKAVYLVPQGGGFSEEPQKHYPIALIGHGNLKYSFSQIGGFDVGILEGGDPSQPGFSIWLNFFDRPNFTKAFLKGYAEPATVKNVLAKTNRLLNEELPEGEDIIVHVFKGV